MNWVMFTAPDGSPLLIDLAEMNYVRPPIPSEEVGSAVGCAIHTGGNRMLVRESFKEVVTAMLQSGIEIKWPDGTTFAF